MAFKRRGLVYVLITLVMLPLFLLFAAMAIETMAYALSSRVAFNYAMIGSTAVTESVELKGGGYILNLAQACEAARRTICAQAPRMCNRQPASQNPPVQCFRIGNEVVIQVSVPRYQFFGAWLSGYNREAIGYNIMTLDSGIEIADGSE